MATSQIAVTEGTGKNVATHAISESAVTKQIQRVAINTSAGVDVATFPVSAASGTIASGAIASGAVASGAVASGAFASGAIGSGALASGSVASGAFASGSIGSGAVASGAVASGAFASGALASGSVASGAIASGAIAAGAMVAGSAVDGHDLTLGVTTGAAVVTDATGTIQQYLRGLVKQAVDVVAGEYETVAASQTTQALGATGATADYLEAVLIVPATVSPGAVTIKDGANAAITIFTGGTNSVSDLAPIYVPLAMKSTAGAWQVTTGAAVSAIGIGNFT